MQQIAYYTTIIFLLLCTEVVSFTPVRREPVSVSPISVRRESIHVNNNNNAGLIVLPSVSTMEMTITSRTGTRSRSRTPTRLHVARQKRSSNANVNVNANAGSGIGGKKKEPYTEISRLKFMLNQLKGNMKESELRATAAERRVAMLQNQITQEINGDAAAAAAAKEEVAQKNRKNEQHFENQIKALKGTIKSVNAAMNAFKKESEKEIEEMQTTFGKDKTEWKQQMEQLQTHLDDAKSDFEAARREAEHLKAEIQALENRMEIREMELKTEAQMNLEKVNKEAKEAQFTLEVEKELLREKLVVSKKRSDDLLKDLEATKVDMTREIVSIRTEAQRKLDDTSRDMEMKDENLKSKQEMIKMLVNERRSVRKLFKVQRYLIKSRIKARLRRLFRR